MRGLRTPHSEKLSGMNAPFDFRYLVVPHTHWDREWYVPFEVFRLRLGAVIDGVLDKLEADPEFRSFPLDGQGIVLEDYAAARPDHVHRLRALLAAGRLEAGPWYVLPDEILVGSEALVRNLLLGRRVCRRFGVEPTAAGYEPDSFGHPAQLPQILAGFGLRTFLFSRGLGDQLDDVGVVFRWQAGGAEVVACQFLPHYDNFARLTTAEEAAERVARITSASARCSSRRGRARSCSRTAPTTSRYSRRCRRSAASSAQPFASGGSRTSSRRPRYYPSTRASSSEAGSRTSSAESTPRACT